MARGKRTRLATGIYEDTYGRTIVVKVHGVQHERRYPPGTPLEELRGHRKALRNDKGAETPRAKRGLLRPHMLAYVEQFPNTSTAHQNASILIGHWLASGFGEYAPAEVTPLMIDTQLGRWANRFKPKTLNDLRRVLGAVYTSLYGKVGQNPVRDVRRRRVVYDDPRGQEYRLIELVLKQLPDRGRPVKGQSRSDTSLTKIRLRVMAYTGLHQAELGRLRPIDLRDIAKKRVWILGRKKGGGTEGLWQPLTSTGVAALRAFVRVNAFGPISTSSMSKSWNRAVEKAKVIWTRWARRCGGGPWPAPDDFRPYDLRHSFGTAVYKTTGDIRAAQRLMRHKSIGSTLRYTAAAVDPRAQHATDQLDAAWERPRRG